MMERVKDAAFIAVVCAFVALFVCACVCTIIVDFERLILRADSTRTNGATASTIPPRLGERLERLGNYAQSA